jgi:hypothetical protein
MDLGAAVLGEEPPLEGALDLAVVLPTTVFGGTSSVVSVSPSNLMPASL